MPMAGELADQLRRHRPADAQEAEHQQSILALLQSSAEPFSRQQYEPGHITASAFVLSPQGDSLLLIHHRKLSLWLQPGGHVDPEDSSVLAGALREVKEETGASATVEGGVFDVDVHPIPARKDEPAHRHFDVRYLVRARSRELSPQLEEVHQARWVPLGELAQVHADASVRRAAQKILAR